MKKTPPLTKNKKKWVKNRSVILRGDRLNYNVSHQNRYSSSINKLVNQMIFETKMSLLRLFKNKTSKEYFISQKESEKIVMDESISSQAKILLNSLMNKFDQLFSLKSKKLSNKMVDDIQLLSDKNLQSSLKKLSGGLSLNTGVVTEGVKNVSNALIAENVSLINSIPQQYFKDVTCSVMRSITTGNGLADLVPDINKYAKQTKRRATNIALDQTRKAYNSINKQRMQNVGVKQFEWVHSAGSIQPRQSHIKINGHIFSFENLENEQAALGVPESDRGIPGHAINCRCTMVPVINFSDDD